MSVGELRTFFSIAAHSAFIRSSSSYSGLASFSVSISESSSVSETSLSSPSERGSTKVFDFPGSFPTSAISCASIHHRSQYHH